MSKINKKPVATNLLLGISGGIAAYKCADLVRKLKQQGFNVRVVMTPAATQFVTEMSLQAVSGHPVHVELFDPRMEAAMGHIELARWADVMLVAPATANSIAKLVQGQADNLVTTAVLATTAPLFIAPAMNQQMWAHPATQNNISQLVERGVTVLGPAIGEQACGDTGAGRMLEPVELAQKLAEFVTYNQMTSHKPLAGKKLLLTAGPTVEAIDPVRFISNKSSGKMGYALAAAAVRAGAQVTLVSGPVNLAGLEGVNTINVLSAAEMFSAVKASIAHADIFIGCAAVADYSPLQIADEKIKKEATQMTLSLKRNPDILGWVAAQSGHRYVVGFAAETHSLKEFALKKLKTKKLDMICANDVSQPDLGFNSDNNKLLLLDANGGEKSLAIASKELLANQIIEQIGLNIQST